MNVKATLETRPKKDGTGTYKVIVIKLSEKSQKLVFLSPTELEVLENSLNSNDKDFWAEIEE